MTGDVEVNGVEVWVVAYFKASLWHLAEGIEENYEHPKQKNQSRTRIQLTPYQSSVEKS